MIKFIIVILFFFNALACKPVSQATNANDSKKSISFVCLKSQSQCDVNTQYGHFSIQFSGEGQQDYIKTELPFQIQLSFDAVDDKYQLKSISSFLEGKTMYMGKVPVFFKKVISDNVAIEKSFENKIMVAESLLASCTEEIMTWQLWLQIEILADDKVQQQDFFIEFDSERL